MSTQIDAPVLTQEPTKKRQAKDESKEPKKKRQRQISVVAEGAEPVVLAQPKPKRERKVQAPQPLYIPPKRVKNYICDSILNAVVNPVLAELQESKQELISKCNTLYSEFHLISEPSRNFLATVYREHIRELREQYERHVWRSIIEEEKKTTPKSDDGKQYLWRPEIVEVLERKNKLLKENSNANLSSVYTAFKKDFYVNFNNSAEHPNNLSGEKLYDYTKKIVQQKKYRVNEEASIYLAAFAENVLVHFIEQSKFLLKNLEKKSLNISVVNYLLTSAKYYLADVGNNYNCFNEARRFLFDANVNQQKSNKFDLELQTLTKAKLNGIVERLCKLYASYDDTTLIVGGDFKILCHGFLLELLRNFGHNMLNIMEHKKERTINTNIVLSLIAVYHTTLNKQSFVNNTFTNLEKTVDDYKVFYLFQKQQKLKQKNDKQLQKQLACAPVDEQTPSQPSASHPAQQSSVPQPSASHPAQQSSAPQPTASHPAQQSSVPQPSAPPTGELPKKKKKKTQNN